MKTTISKLQDVHQQLLSLSRELGSSDYWKEVSDTVNVAKLVEDMRELEHLQAYLMWIKRISTLRYEHYTCTVKPLLMVT